MKLSELLLQSGNDIPFREAKINIHQPIIKDIGVIGEESFFSGCEMLNFSKDKLSGEDKNNLKNMTNFDVFMSIMRDKKNTSTQKSRINALLVLNLMFPDYKILVGKDQIFFTKEDEASDVIHSINRNNFEIFKDILKQMFCLKQGDVEYNPGNSAMAQRIADKLNKGRQEVAERKGTNSSGQQKIAVFSRYISILAVGGNKNKNELLQYTVYQLYDEIERFEAKYNYDIYLQAKLAGAKNLKEVKSWMRDLYEE